MKAKQCSYEGCTYVGTLWQSSPRLCKTHAMMVKAEGKGVVTNSVTGTNKDLAPFYKKVYSTIKKTSDKQLERLKEYRIVRDKFLDENKFCMICGKIATDLHHKKSRGKHLCDVSTFMAVCRGCHDRIHNNHAESVRQGYIISKLED